MKIKQQFISVVMPCLNEENAVGKCVTTALSTLHKFKIKGEVIVADNGSFDNSVQIASKAGAKVVHAKERGYGAAYLAGLRYAKGDIIIIGDSDGTYNFSQIPDFINKINEGYEFVIGSRLRGRIQPGAFSFSHRYIGVPLLTSMLNLLFKTRFSDAHCGMRAFTRESYSEMDLRCQGMEFASEMIVKASGASLKSTEIPIQYLRRIGQSKLLGFSDAWRHIRFMLLFAPTFLFIIPGIFLIALGMSSLFLLISGPFFLFNIGFDIHTMAFSSVLSILGMNILMIGLFAKLFALFGDTGLIKSETVKFFMNRLTQRDILKGGTFLFVCGLIISIYVLKLWIDAKLGGISEMRAVILAMTFMVLGAQIIFASFFASLMIDRYKKII